MKRKTLTLLSIAAILLVLIQFLSSSSPNTVEQKNQVLLKQLMGALKFGHYSPKIIDDSLSINVYKVFLKRLDRAKRFLIQSDVDELNTYQFKIDDDINNNTFTFFDRANDIISKRINDAEKYYSEILSQPFDYSIDETLNLDPDKYEFCKDTSELKEIWRKMLKYETLGSIVSTLDIQEEAKKNEDTSITIKEYDTIEVEAREKIKKRYKDLFHRISKFDKTDRSADYLNTIANYYDPHTGYFPPKDKEDFDISMSGKLEGIGALLTQRDEYIKVERIVPGSPSWKQGELKAGDIILKVAQGDGEPLDIVDMRLDKAVRFIRGKKGTEVRLTVKKLDASIVIISIIRDVVYQEETFAKSVVIKNNGRSYGYTKLPKFYADFKDGQARRCSDDIKKEIEKLKSDNIEGMILDLRNNGGGSLQDAVLIAGLFIETGPVVQVHTRHGQPKIYRDYDSKIQYDGPLIILVNSISASASEIVAAALQDYKRAIIVGSSSSYGKGTVQTFMDLDRGLPTNYSSMKPLGALKITIQKFYRINGATTQLKGVVPDIILPDRFTYYDIGERELDNALAWDELTPLNYLESGNYLPTFENYYDHIINNVKTDSTFIMIDENAKYIKESRDKTEVSLEMESFKEEKRKRKENSKKYENLNKKEFDLSIFNLRDDKIVIESDSTKKTSFDEWHKEIKKDAYINEAVEILNLNKEK